jgi:hypothetical protein
MTIDPVTKADLIVAGVRLRRALEQGDETTATSYRKRIDVLLDRLLESTPSANGTR